MDFCGFSFNGHHSSEMGFIRVSDGNRYEDTLGPNFQDKTVAIPGGDGTYFFESLYTQKPFPINIAFDSMTETQLRTLRQVFNGKDVGPLVFDEEPYKAYIVKLQSPVQLKYVCFDSPAETSSTWIHNHVLSGNDEPSPMPSGGEGKITKQRLYKGEGTINFVAYKPYALARHKYLDDFETYASEDIIDQIAVANMDEWEEASRIPKNASIYSMFDSRAIEPDGTYNQWIIYNPGDIEMGFKMYFSKGSIMSYPIFTIEENIVDMSTSSSAIHNYLALDFTDLTSRLSSDSNATYICVNTDTQLIEGCTTSHELTGYLYNDAIQAGELLKIPPVPNSRYCSNVIVKTNVSGAQSSMKIQQAERRYLYY